MNEAAIQKAVFQNLRERGSPGVVFWHTPNDPASRRKSGYREGVSDVAILHRGKFYAVELKVPKGHPNEKQLEFVADVNAAGGYAFVAQGLDEALCALEQWGVLRGAA